MVSKTIVVGTAYCNIQTNIYWRVSTHKNEKINVVWLPFSLGREGNASWNWDVLLYVKVYMLKVYAMAHLEEKENSSDKKGKRPGRIRASTFCPISRESLGICCAKHQDQQSAFYALLLAWRIWFPISSSIFQGMSVCQGCSKMCWRNLWVHLSNFFSPWFQSAAFVHAYLYRCGIENIR